MTAREKRDKWRRLQKELPQIASDILFETKDAYIALQREQMNYGFNSEGKRIGVYANPAYERMKQQQNPLAGGWVDLKLKGDYQAGLTLKLLSKSKFEIDSTDEKAKMLAAKYDKNGNVYFLDEENKQKYRGETFMPRLREVAKEVTN